LSDHLVTIEIIFTSRDGRTFGKKRNLGKNPAEYLTQPDAQEYLVKTRAIEAFRDAASFLGYWPKQKE
jgi:hypothetical protein